ncbi:heme-degrading domain-containing protein [Paraburkholderia sp. GAS199]|uniref:heme-degrading domain-containing protein n=1 Tax=Paraburkholderia sp. GAS199 TaxID=3035126 RepID=UPI003D1A5940
MDIDHDLQVMTAQEKALVFPHFDADRAWQIGAYLHEVAKARGIAAAIDVRTFGQPLFFSLLPGATPDNVDWARRKGNTVAHFRCSSYAVGLKLKQANSTLAERHGLPVSEYASHGGAFPLSVAGAGVIGSITVSGLPQRADHELVVEALCAHLGLDYAALALAKV